MSDSEQQLVDSLADEFLDRLQRGEAPTIAEYEQAHPECAAEIRRVFASVQMFEQLARRRWSKGLSGRAAGRPPERLGDYRILREIGRGGMGVVYEAEQLSLGRRVAVKVLPSQSLADAKSAQRFAREAQTAAKLRHTNIVPVFGVGEDQGYHYFVMQRIEGLGLDVVLARLQASAGEAAGARLGSDVSPATGRVVSGLDELLQAILNESTEARGPDESEQTAGPFTFRCATAYWRSVVDLGIQVAEALQHAHSQGILHRDIKPANLLLDAQGIVCVADFGLAKVIGGESLSQSGDLVGTLRYMAPEQFSGNADARSDVYSLGLTLYELLALRPAFEASNRSELIRKITQDDVVGLRRVNPQIPRDLETIVAKATAREPGARYQSAAQLGSDLRCYLEDRPIHARRVTAVEQLWRWCRRNRAVASLAAVAVSLLALVAVVATIGYVRTSRANTQVKAALAKSERISGLSLEALDEIFERFAPDRSVARSEAEPAGAAGADARTLVQPVLSTETAALLEHMISFYARLAQAGAGDVELRQKVADAHRRVGDIRQRLGQAEQAEDAYLQALEQYQQLQRERPGDPAVVCEVGRIHNEVGNVQWARGRPAAAHAAYRKALEALAALPLEPSPPAQFRFELARTYYFLGKRPGRESGPGPPDPKAEPDRPDGGRPGRPPPPPHTKGDRPDPDFGPETMPDREPRDVNLNKAIAILEPLVGQYPAVPEYRLMLARCYREFPPQEPGRPTPSVQDPLDKATAVLEKLAEDYPDVSDYRYELSETLATPRIQGPRFIPADDPAAERRLRQALEISQELAREHPNIPDYASAQIHIHHKLAHVLRDTGRAEEAEADLRTALDLQTVLVRQLRAVSSYHVWQAVIQESLADLQRERGELNEARTLLEAAVATLRDCQARERTSAYQHLLVRNYENLADVLDRLGERELAAAARRQAQKPVADGNPGELAPYR